MNFHSFPGTCGIMILDGELEYQFRHAHMIIFHLPYNKYKILICINNVCMCGINRLDKQVYRLTLFTEFRPVRDAALRPVASIVCHAFSFNHWLDPFR